MENYFSGVASHNTVQFETLSDVLLAGFSGGNWLETTVKIEGLEDWW